AGIDCCSDRDVSASGSGAKHVPVARLVEHQPHGGRHVDERRCRKSTAPGGFYQGSFGSFVAPTVGASASVTIAQFGNSPAPLGTWTLGIGPMADVVFNNSLNYQGTGGGLPIRDSGQFTQLDFLAGLKLTTSLTPDYNFSIFGGLGGA